MIEGFMNSPHNQTSERFNELLDFAKKGMEMRSGRLKLNTKISVPSTRDDVGKLVDWVRTMLNSISKDFEEIPVDEVFKSLQTVYSAALQEIIRQVTLECKDRGEILQKLWNSYMDILEKAHSQVRKNQHGKEIKHIQECRDLHISYQRKIEEINREYLDFKGQIAGKDEEISDFKEKWNYVKKKFIILDQELNSKKQELTELSINQSQLSEENKILRKLLQESGVKGFGQFHEINKIQEISKEKLEKSRIKNQREFDKKKLDEGQEEYFLASASTDTSDLIISLNKGIGTQNLEYKDSYCQSEVMENKNNSPKSNRSRNSSNNGRESSPTKQKSKFSANPKKRTSLMIPFSSPRKGKRSSSYVSGSSKESLISEEKPKDEKLRLNLKFSSSPVIQESEYNEEQELEDSPSQGTQQEITLFTPDNPLFEHLKNSNLHVVDKLDMKKIYEANTFEEESSRFPTSGKRYNKSNQDSFEKDIEKSDYILKYHQQKNRNMELLKELEELKMQHQQSTMEISEIHRLISRKDDKIYKLKSKEMQSKNSIQEISEKLTEVLSNIAASNDWEKYVKDPELTEIVSNARAQGNLSPLKKNKPRLKSQIEITDFGLQEISKSKSVIRGSEMMDRPTYFITEEGEENKENNDEIEEEKKSSSLSKSKRKVSFIDSSSRSSIKGKTLVPDSFRSKELSVNSPQTLNGDFRNNDRRRTVVPPLENDESLTTNNELAVRQSPVPRKRMSVIRSKMRSLIKMNVFKNFKAMESDDDESSFDDEKTFNSRKKLSVIKIPFSAPKKQMKKFSVNTESATSLYSQILKKAQKGQIKPMLSLNSLLKVISSIYVDRLKSAQNTMNPFYVILYDTFLHKYGLKKVAEHKFVQILESCLCYNNNLRIQNFSKLCQIHVEPWDKDIGNFFFEIIKVLDEHNAGISLLASTSASIFVPYIRCIECSEKIFTPETLNESQELLEKMREEVTTDRRSTQIIELDAFLKCMITIKQEMISKKGKNIEDLFYAADLDGDRLIEYYEFLILYRNVEKEKFKNERDIRQLFFDESDLISNKSGEQAISLERFISISFKYSIFSLEAQEKFSKNISSAVFSLIKKNPIQNFEDLKKNWDEEFAKIKKRLLYSKTYDATLEEIIQNLNKSMHKEKTRENVLWLSYRLLEEESIRSYIEFRFYNEGTNWNILFLFNFCNSTIKSILWKKKSSNVFDISILYSYSLLDI